MMLITLRDIYEQKVKVDRQHVIYILREGEMVIYVGKGETSRDIAMHLANCQHDDLHCYLLRRFPASLDFQQIELLTITDCLERVEPFSHRIGWRVTALDCEAELIRFYQPLLNKCHNTARRKYRDRIEQQYEED
jgi:hypothetical protein